MADSIDILKKLALQVRNASTAGENTAERVGRTLVGIIDNLGQVDIEELAKIFLRKDKPDSTSYLLKLLAGAEFGKFATGTSGGRIDPSGNSELLDLILRGVQTIGKYVSGVSGDGVCVESGYGYADEVDEVVTCECKGQGEGSAEDRDAEDVDLEALDEEERHGAYDPADEDGEEQVAVDPLDEGVPCEDGLQSLEHGEVDDCRERGSAPEGPVPMEYRGVPE